MFQGGDITTIRPMPFPLGISTFRKGGDPLWSFAPSWEPITAETSRHRGGSGRMYDLFPRLFERRKQDAGSMAVNSNASQVSDEPPQPAPSG